MKTQVRNIGLLIAATGLLPALCLAGNEAPTPKPDQRREVRVIMHDEGGDALAPATYLGVVAAPVSPALAAQLGLPPGIGLQVEILPEDSPAKSVLQKFDVLHKIDDQLLTDIRQLSVLVRMHKEGDEVALTLFRSGKSQVAKVKLGSKKLPPLAHLDRGAGPAALHRMMPMERRDVDVMLHGMGADPHAEVRIIKRGEEGPERRSIVHREKRVYVIDDGASSLQLSGDEGARVVVIKDKEGKELYRGPFNTPEDRAKVPEQFRKRLEVLENPKQFMQWHTDDSFEGPPPPPPAPKAPGAAD